MKFIRTIIDESSGDGARDPGASDARANPNRTYTRISPDGDTEDLVNRLLSESDPADETPSRRGPVRGSDDDDAEAGNLFAAADDDEDEDEDEDDLFEHQGDGGESWTRYADPNPPEDTMEQADTVAGADPIAQPVIGRSSMKDAHPVPTRAPSGADGETLEMPAPASGRSGQTAGRVKTRLLGFGRDIDAHDPFARTGAGSEGMRYPVGWLVIVSGPGRGNAFALSAGVSQIGRGEDQTIRLDFGDTAISRSNHAAVAYDPEEGSFFLGHGGKANMVRMNNRPVLSTEPLTHGAMIRIGETTLRFAAFCDADFNWDQDGANDHASRR